ncbi:MAG: Stk1 family PASTA domain-containing Ser/Thr kinase [Filifactoraceae bacterium]
MIGKLLGNRYEILNKVGEGGMAVVYTGKCTLLNRIVAIKVLKSEFSKDEEFLTKFKNEAQSAARVNHPNIINVYDVGQDGDESYIVMEYVEGKNLKDMIKTNGRMPEAVALDIADQIAKALQVAHMKGIVHRDIKSHNIMITSNNLVKVGDFGIAKAVSSATITAAGSIMGSVHYFSPEQARGGYVDERSDIYSLGIVLFEMLTGRLPFDGDSPVNIALKQIQDNIEFLPSDNIRPEVKNLILKLTQKSPDKRQRTAGEVISEVAVLRGHRPTKIIAPEDVIKEDFKLGVDSYKAKNQLKEEFEEEYDEKDDEKKSFKLGAIAILLALLVSVVGVGGFVLLGGFDNISSVFTRKEKVLLEDFRGLTLEEAKEKGTALGVQVVQDGTEINNSYPEGTVASQVPSSGVKVEKNSLVRVSISATSIEEVEVPDLKGYTLEEAIKLITNVGLSEVVKAEASDKPKDEVISQMPEAGAKVNKGELVKLVVSEGKEEPKKDTQVPNVIEKSSDEARQILKGFTISESYREDRTKPDGVILSQAPTAGEMVEAAATVNIVINRIEKRPTVNYPLLIMLPTENETINVKVIEKNTGSEIYNSDIEPSSLEGGILKFNTSGEQGETKVYSVYIDGRSWGDQEVIFQ